MSTVVGVSGAHGTGKTTFLRDLRRELERRSCSVVLVQDLASEAAKLGFPILREHTVESTLWIITEGIARELSGALRADVVLVDRTVLDAVAYYQAAVEHRAEHFAGDEIEGLQSIVQSHLHRYDCLFITQVDHTIPLDTSAGRDGDKSFRDAVAHNILDAAIASRRNHTELTPSSRDACLQLALEAHFGPAQRGDNDG